MRESDITRHNCATDDMKVGEIQNESRATTLAVFADTATLGRCFASLSADEFCAGFAALPDVPETPPGRVALSEITTLKNTKNNEFIGVMAQLMGLLVQSPTGRGLLDAGIQAGVTLGCDPLQPASRARSYAPRYGMTAHIDFGNYTSFDALSDKARARLFAGLVAGLRRAWHDHQASAPDLRLTPADYLEHTRLMMADSEAVMHLVAWELRGCGESLLWHSLLGGASADIANVFEESITLDAQNQFNGLALKAAFNQWFICGARVTAAEQLALETIDAALATDRALLWSSAGVCSRVLVREELGALGALPDGQNYLAGCQFSSLWYGGLSDSGNRAHLRHLLAELSI